MTDITKRHKGEEAVMAKKLTLAQAMQGAQPDPDHLKLTYEQRLVKVIQALVADNGGECWIAPHAFADPDSLVVEHDERGNICLKAEKSVFAVN